MDGVTEASRREVTDVYVHVHGHVYVDGACPPSILLPPARPRTSSISAMPAVPVNVNVNVNVNVRWCPWASVMG